jgi:small subunit ribosomal protein S6
MNNYRLTLLVKNDLAEGARKALFDDVVKSFGKVTKEDIWGARGLSYPIQHQSQAFFAHFEFESEPSTIAPLDKKLKLNEDVIRYLLLKVEVKKESARKARARAKKEAVTVEESKS